MVIRTLEHCPVCGTVNPWRVYASRIVCGQRRNYAYCKVCHRHETIVYKPFVPRQGTKSS